MNLIGLRFFTVYGEWGRPDMLLFKLFKSFKQNKIFYLNNKGNHFRDFTYIKDFIQGIALCINSKNAKNQIFNLTYGEGRSINQLIEILKKEFPSIEIETKDREKFTPERGTLSVEKAKKLNGIPKSIPSSLSSIPPCPGKKFPVSFNEDFLFKILIKLHS